MPTLNSYRGELGYPDKLSLKWLSDLLLAIRDDGELERGERSSLLAKVDKLIWSRAAEHNA